jgi:hypothetical protein
VRTKRKATITSLAAHEEEGQKAGSSGELDVEKRAPSNREKPKELKNWSIRLKRNSRGELGIIVEGTLTHAPPGNLQWKTSTMQWKTSFIQQRDSATRVRTTSGSIYVLHGRMDMGANKDLSAEMAAKFKVGFPVNFKQLLSEAEALLALKAADLEAAAQADGKEGGGGGGGSVSRSEGVGGELASVQTFGKEVKTSKRCQDSARKGTERKASCWAQKEAVSESKLINGEKEGGECVVGKEKVEWKNLNQMQVLTCFAGTKVLAYWDKSTNTDTRGAAADESGLILVHVTKRPKIA